MGRAELANGCCGFFSLTQGVLIVAVMDLIQGALTVFLGLCVLSAPAGQYNGHALAHHFLWNETTDLAVIVMSSIGAASAYFALCAIRGVRAVDPALLWKFLLWKAGRAFFFSLLLFSDMWKTLGTPLQGSYMFLFVMSTAWRAYLLWIIFSLYEKINLNDPHGVASAGYDRTAVEEHMPIVGHP